MEKALTKKLIYKVVSPIIGSALIASITTGIVFAWPTKGPNIDCFGIHWEMQNDTNVTHQFTGHITSPIEYTMTSEVKPNEWGILDKSFTNLSGNVTVTASISMGGDTRNTTKTIECAQPTPSPSPMPTPTPSPSPTPTPSPSPTPSPTPTSTPVSSPEPTPSPCTNCGGPEINITNNNNNTNNNTNNNNISVASTSTANVPAELPQTGPGSIAIATMAGLGPLGFALSKFKKGQLYKEEQSLEEFASSIFKDRTGNLN